MNDIVRNISDVRRVAPFVGLYKAAQLINPYAYGSGIRRTNLMSILKDIGISAFTTKDNSFMCRADWESKRITVMEDVWCRSRFLLAHTLGHLLLHTNEENSVYQCNGPQDKHPFHIDQEIEANNFASELLMPLHMVENFCGGQRPKSTYEVATLFGVSVPAAKYSIRKLL